MIDPEPEDALNAFVNEEVELQQGENMAAHAETQIEAFGHLYRKTYKHQAPYNLTGTLKLKQRRSIICTRKLAIIKYLTGTPKPTQKSLTISS